MWYVHHKEDGWECGWSVKSEAEAKKYCRENPDCDYEYVDNYYLGGMDYAYYEYYE